MATKKFWLEMADSHMVTSLGDLRQYGDKNSVLRYFNDGTLERWLEAYDYDELEDVQAIPKNAPDVSERLKDILQLSWPEEDDILAQRQEKNFKLRQWTDDQAILSKIDSIALNDGDLVGLLRNGVKKVYLCAKEGNIFNIRLKYKHIKYIGILGTPMAETKAVSSHNLAEYGITVEDINLPWGHEGGTATSESTSYQNISERNSSADKTMNRLRDYFKKAFGMEPGWEIVDSDGNVSKTAPDEYDKETIFKRLGIGGDKKLLHAKVASDLSWGWAFTNDSICTMEDMRFCVDAYYSNSTKMQTSNIEYNSIKTVKYTPHFEGYLTFSLGYDGARLELECIDGNEWGLLIGCGNIWSIRNCIYKGYEDDFKKIAIYLDRAKDL